MPTPLKPLGALYQTPMTGALMPPAIIGGAVDPSMYRKDGSMKGKGFLGILSRPDKAVSTELSIGVDIDGKEMEIPSLVPTLTKQEVDHLLGGGEMTDAIVQKAVDHARMRMQQGLPVFAE